MRRIKRHCAALEDRRRRPAGQRGPGPCGRGRWSCRGREPVPRPTRLRALVLVNAAIDVVQIHDERDSPQPLDFVLGCAVACSACDRGLDQIGRIVRAEALGEDVVDAGRFAHRAHRAAGDHAGTGRGGHQHHVGRAVAAFDRVRNRACHRATRRSCCACRP